jgi:hypothetical protein
MTMATFPPMPATEAAAVRRLMDAWAEGEARSFLHAYKEVMAQLQELNSKHVVANIVNELLKIMKLRKLTIHGAAKELMKEMEHPRSRMFVMAAAVDVALHARKAGDTVKEIPDWQDALKAAL